MNEWRAAYTDGVSRIWPRVAVVVAAGGGVALAAAGGSASRPDSGVRGKVVESGCAGPMGGTLECERPLAAEVVVRRRGSGAIMARTHTKAGGRFRVRLRSGAYVVRAVADADRADPDKQVRVDVKAHRFSRVTIRFASPRV